MDREQVRAIAQATHHVLRNLYQDQLAAVVLFGSQARGDAQPDSDIDLLIVLRHDFRYYQEVHRIGGLISDLCLDYGVLISCALTTFDQWQQEDSAFYRNIRREGVLL